jgi:hypothetical protein
VKDLHKKKNSALFIKLDISKAFDSVSWPYLLGILQHLGFGVRWRNWISSLWCTTSSCYLLNGKPGKRILHCRGVRQGDHLSPMLFLLAMEPLHRLFKKAQETNLLDKVSKGCHEFRISLYADNAAVFIKPTTKDLQVTNTILELFVGASGLVTNMDKTQFYPIQCSHIDLKFLSQHNCKVADFPCCYLGLPLHYKKLPRSFMHEVIQKIANSLPGWKRGLMSYPGREMLIKSVLSAMPIYFLSILRCPNGILEKLISTGGSSGKVMTMRT